MAEEKKAPKQVLPLKTRRMIKIYTENPGITKAEAGRRAGYKHKSSSHRALTKANPTFLQKMDEAGLTEEALLAHTREGLQASSETEKIQKTEDGTTETKVMVKTPEFNVRHRYLETAWKLRGKLKEGNTVNNNTLIVQDRNGTIENIRRAITRKAH